VKIVPIELKDLNALVASFHRHHKGDYAGLNGLAENPLFPVRGLS
jgi:hypothetical protein